MGYVKGVQGIVKIACARRPGQAGLDSARPVASPLCYCLSLRRKAFTQVFTLCVDNPCEAFASQAGTLGKVVEKQLGERS